MKEKNFFIKKIIFYLISFALILLILEVCMYIFMGTYYEFRKPRTQYYFRDNWKKFSFIAPFYNDGRSSRFEFDTLFAPDLKANFPYFGNSLFETDQYGFTKNYRGQQRDLSIKKDNVYRIFLIGGSTVYGWGSDYNEQTISNQLEKLLNKDNVNQKVSYEVINAGIGNAISSGELRLLALKIIKFQPDLVISFDGINDFITSLEENHIVYPWDFNKNGYDKRVEYNYSRMKDISSTSLLLSEKIFMSFSKTFLPQTYEFAKRAFQVYKREKLGIYPFQMVVRLEGVDNYLNNLASIRGVCAAHNIQCVNILQPNLVWNKPMSSSEREFLDMWNDKAAKGYEVNMTKYYEYATKKFSQLSKIEPDVGEVVDMTDLFSEMTETIYVDDCHYNPKGNKIIAEEFLKIIKRIK